MAIQPWLPGFVHVDLDLTGVQAPEVGRPYDETSHPKICLHTTEGSSLEGAERAFAAYPPHFGVDYRTRRYHQYLPLDRCSFSLRGSENDDEFVVQVEIVGFAARTPDMSDDELDWLGREVIAPIAAAIGCPLVPAPQGFKAPGDVPFTLASASSPLRFPSEAALRAFSGVMAHQHAPAPDAHWDVGGIDIDRILSAARGDDLMPALTDAEQRELLRLLREVHADTATNTPDCRLREVVLTTRALAGEDPLQPSDIEAGGAARPPLKTLVQGAILDGLRKSEQPGDGRGALRGTMIELLREAMTPPADPPPAQPSS